MCFVPNLNALNKSDAEVALFDVWVVGLLVEVLGYFSSLCEEAFRFIEYGVG